LRRGEGGYNHEVLPAKFASPFNPGELVLHTTHGLSRYVGTREVEATDGTIAQYFQLDYAEGHRVFVPVEHVARLSKYVGEEAALARLTTTEQRSPYSRSQKPAVTPTPAPA
jgi:transcription-repair coupling factor (superfamily II helicase)